MQISRQLTTDVTAMTLAKAIINDGQRVWRSVLAILAAVAASGIASRAGAQTAQPPLAPIRLSDPAALPDPVPLTDPSDSADEKPFTSGWTADGSLLEDGTCDDGGWVGLEMLLDKEDLKKLVESDEEKKEGGGKPTVNLTIELQADSAWFRQDEDNITAVGEIPDGSFFRRSRFGIFGKLYDAIEYRTEWDFAGDARPRFLDNWVALTDVPYINNIIVGHYFEPFSLERYTPNRFITFTERSLTDTFAPARNMGAMVYGNLFDERMTWAGGIFRTSSDDYGDSVTFGDDFALTLHSTFLAWFEEDDEFTRRLLHLGASGSVRHPGSRQTRFANRPSVRMREQGVGGVPLFVDTGDILDVKNYYLYGLEAAWVHGPWSLQGEWIGSTVERRTTDNPRFESAYIYGTWFLTGESRSYSPTSILGRFREGIFQRVDPRTNVFDRTQGGGWTGCGAWELAVRWSFIDLNDAGIEGGRIEEMTYGVNWYLNRYTKVMFNYVRPKLIDPNMGRSRAEAYVARLQFEY